MQYNTNGNKKLPDDWTADDWAQHAIEVEQEEHRYGNVVAFGVTLDSLADAQRWVAWRLTWQGKESKPAKVPYDPRSGRFAKVPTDPRTYATREMAAARAAKLTLQLQHECRKHNHQLTNTTQGCGTGIVLGPLDADWHLGGIDLDSCRDAASGEIAAWAQEVIARFDTYAEVSPSGTGVKLFYLVGSRDMDQLRALLGYGDNGRQRTRHSLPVSTARSRSTPQGSMR